MEERAAHLSAAGFSIIITPGMREKLLGLLLLVLVSALSFAVYSYWRARRYDDLIARAAEKYGLEFALVKALVHEESWYDAGARGADGEMGLMQVMPLVGYEYAAAKKLDRFKSDWLLDPEVNLEVGCWYLRQCLDKYKSYGDPLPLALARYNAGESRVQVWIDQARHALSDKEGDPQISAEAFLRAVDFPQTRGYIESILKRYRRANRTKRD